MKQILMSAMLLVSTLCMAQQTITLPAPNLQRETKTVMETYQSRHSTRTFAQRQLSEQDLSDLLWAAQGKNREDGKLTAPTAMNRQEIRLYAFCEKGVTLYDPQQHTLTWVAEGDHRDIAAGRQEFAKTAPLILVMVADMDKFGKADQHAQLMVSVDCGIVCENINLFCSAIGLNTVPRATMDQEAIQKLLGLNENQIPLMNNPVGYPEE